MVVVISIHTLRMEGDGDKHELYLDAYISIHTLRMEGDPIMSPEAIAEAISIHTLRMEGDPAPIAWPPSTRSFQSTPSAWRVTRASCKLFDRPQISIHTLRMEGDRARRI